MGRGRGHPGARPPRRGPQNGIGRAFPISLGVLVWSPSTRCCSDWRPAATSRPTPSKSTSAKSLDLRRPCARDWPWAGDMPPFTQVVGAMANSRCGARSSTFSPWARDHALSNRHGLDRECVDSIPALRSGDAALPGQNWDRIELLPAPRDRPLHPDAVARVPPAATALRFTGDLSEAGRFIAT